jgi:CRP/FNR family transcriptional regulator
MGSITQGTTVNDDFPQGRLPSDEFSYQLSEETANDFESLKQLNLNPKGAILYSQGQPPRGVFVIGEGRVKLSVTAADGKILIVEVAGAGAILGLSANISGEPFGATAETLELSRTDFIKRDDFLGFLRNHGDACFRVAEYLSQNCHTAYAQISSLGLSHSALEKLGRLLLGWCNGNGRDAGAEVHLKVGLTHEEMARMIGTSRETVSRMFRELKDRQLIAQKGSTLIVRDRAALEQLINS